MPNRLSVNIFRWMDRANAANKQYTKQGVDTAGNMAKLTVLTATYQYAILLIDKAIGFISFLLPSPVFSRLIC